MLEVENRTDSVLVILDTRGGRDVKVVSAPPGRTSGVPLAVVDDNGCIVGAGYVAVDTTGRRTQPRKICDRDVWTLTTQDFSSR